LITLALCTGAYTAFGVIDAAAAEPSSPGPASDVDRTKGTADDGQPQMSIDPALRDKKGPDYDDTLKCAHSRCKVGGALDESCSGCVSDICDQDPFCCETEWDSLCVEEVGTICEKTCYGAACDHKICKTGDPLADGCDYCVTEVCAQDSFCCDIAWDDLCVDQLEQSCGASCD
jgi:hypothetical protein